MREATDPWAPPASTDAKRSWGPLTEGLNVPRDLDLGDRAKALEQLGVNRLAHATIVGVVKDVLPETQVGLLVGSTTVGRLVDATLDSLTTPPSTPAAPASRVRVSRRRPAPAPPPPRPPRPPASRPRRKPQSPLTGSRPHRPRARGVRGDGGGSPHPDAAGAVSGCGRIAYGCGRVGGPPPAGTGSQWRGC
ncbi:hypothetical protein ACFWUZ_35770 [Streptomyces sp. NPDC058646]|uniref:hypothetical protein n=1 Tax=Streptomyces sp. NPDC058646 TaxID=3346574 RepID=UPI0036655DBF